MIFLSGAAIVALGKALKFDATTEELRSCLLDSAMDIDHLQPDRSRYRNKLGAGLVDAHAFLNCLILDEGTCGNSRFEEGEVCDTNQLGNYTKQGCIDYGYDLGDIVCTSDCKGFDFSECTSIFLDQPFLSGSSGSEKRFTVDIPTTNWDGLTEVRFELSYTGSPRTYVDADLYVRRDGPPSRTAHDCLSVKPGSDEHCTFTEAGTYHVLILGHSTYRNVNLLVTANGKPSEPACGNTFLEDGEMCDGNSLNSTTCQDLGYTGGTLACQSDCKSFDTRNCYNTIWRYQADELPRGQVGRAEVDMTRYGQWERLQVIAVAQRSLSDVDLYVRQTNLPTTKEYDCASVGVTSSREECNIVPDPTSDGDGIYNVLVYPFLDSELVITTARVYDPREAAVPTTAPPTTSAVPSTSPAPSGSGLCRPECATCFNAKVREAGCSSCVQCANLVCAQDAYCCNTYWDASWYVPQRMSTFGWPHPVWKNDSLVYVSACAFDVDLQWRQRP